METTSLFLGLSCLFCAALTVGLSIPLLRGEVKRNGLYGVRLPESLASEEAWLDINRYGARRMILWSVPVFALGIAAFFVSFEGREGLALAFGLAPVLVFGAVFETVRYARNRSGDADA